MDNNTEKTKNHTPRLKIVLAVAVIVAVIAVAVAIGGKNGRQPDEEKTTAEKIESIEHVKSETVSESDKETIEKTTDRTTPTISIGQTVKTDEFEFTLNSVELSYNVKPDNPPSVYSYYTATSGQVYIYLNATVKNLLDYDVGCDCIYSVKANYNNGYEYTGFNIITDYDGDFSYSNINSITPLQTMGVHCLIDCPKEVETSDNPLSLTIKMRDGTEFLYTVR